MAIDAATGIAEIDLAIRAAPSPPRVCADMPGSAAAVVSIRQATPAGERDVPRDPDDDDCFLPTVATDGSITLHYRADLGRLASRHGNPDQAARFGPDWIFTDEALLLRPDPLPAGAPITVEFRPAPGTTVAVPWDRLPGPALRYALDAAQFDAGSYIALGKVVELGTFAIKNGRVRVSCLDQAHRTTNAELVEWVRSALAAVGDFYGELPGGSAHVILAPIRESTTSGIFGTVFRRGRPSVVLLFGADAAAADFKGEWMAFHEFFHMGNPRIKGRIPWFIEGFTTYYEDVVRARAGAHSPTEMIAELHDKIARNCQPVGGKSLAHASQVMNKEHSYGRVYSGGACLAFRLDVELRRHTKNKRSLDDVLRAMRASGKTLDEDALVAALDREVGWPLVREQLNSTKPIPIKALEDRLGIEPVGKTVRLHDDAPDADIRRAIMGEKEGVGSR